MLLVVVNPACGDKGAPTFVHDHVIPLLTERNASFVLVQTESPGHSGHLARQFLADTTISSPKAILIASGDGTVHEIVNEMLLGDPVSARVPLVLVPCGTANALYSSCFPQSSSDPIGGKLRALRSYLDNGSKRRLNLTRTDVYPTQAASDPEHTIYSMVVTSTSLHASILHDSEALRGSVPGLERFKLAAQQNISRLYHATVHLLPYMTHQSAEESGDVIQLYDPAKSAFAPLSPSTVEGPFAYFLSTANADRLEPAFRITPLVTAHAPAPGTASMDIVILRPQRAPNTAISEAFTTELNMRVLTQAYQDGAHVNLVFDKASGTTNAYGEHPASVNGEVSVTPVVEYVRCGGWEWIPDTDDDRARLICADGTIMTVPPGGKARCEVLQNSDVEFEVFV